MQPTPTRSPTWWRVTPEPISAHGADDLVARTTGNGCGPSHR